MAEFVMKDLVKRAGAEDRFFIESAATSTEEIWGGIGNPVYPPARRKLAEHGLSCSGKRARQITRQDYEKYDLIIGMDQNNLRAIRRICGRDDKTHLLMEYAGETRDVADPWYTGDFDARPVELPSKGKRFCPGGRESPARAKIPRQSKVIPPSTVSYFEVDSLKV